MTAEEYVENWDRLNDADKRSLLKDFRAAMAEARAQALREAIAIVDKQVTLEAAAHFLQKLAGGAT